MVKNVAAHMSRDSQQRENLSHSEYVYIYANSYIDKCMCVYENMPFIHTYVYVRFFF